MKTTAADPWLGVDSSSRNEKSSGDCSFEDSFTATLSATLENPPRLPDSEQYLARLNSRLKAIQGGTSKHDLINSLSNAKEDCIARLITDGQSLESAEEKELASNPLIRHVAPHLQALTASELVHLLKADTLQAITDEQNIESPQNEETENKLTDSQSDIQIQDSNGL